MQDGYHLKRTGPYTFACQKLGQISVRIYGENSELLPSVLLSLSGEEGYRNNSISSSGGTFIFDNLFPGSFYLRPLLKVLLLLCSLSLLIFVSHLLNNVKVHECIMNANYLIWNYNFNHQLPFHVHLM